VKKRKVETKSEVRGGQVYISTGGRLIIADRNQPIIRERGKRVRPSGSGV